MKRQRDRKRERDLDARDKRAEDEEHEFAIAQEKESLERAEKAKQKQIEEEEARKAGMIDVEAPTEEIIVTRIMTKEERIAAIQALVAQIPADKEGLWSWSVQWDYLDSTILKNKIEPFLKKKVVEYIGDESNDLVSFIMEKITAHEPVQSIQDELSPVYRNLYFRF